jgi:hypothetical protein
MRPAPTSGQRVAPARWAFAAGFLVLMAVTGLAATPGEAAALSSARAAHAPSRSSVPAHRATTTTTTTTVPPAAPPSGGVTRSAHVGYLDCPAPDVLLTASIQERAFAPGQLVTYRVSVHNLSRATCGTRGRILPTIPTTPNFAEGLLGPCGEISVVIYDADGTNVYPGPVAFGCPMILGPSIAPGQSIATTGTWEQTGTRGPGSYRLVIDGKVTLPIVIAGSAPSAPGAPSPPMPTPGPTPVFPGSSSLPIPSTRVPPPSALPTPTVPSRLPRAGSSSGTSELAPAP